MIKIDYPCKPWNLYRVEKGATFLDEAYFKEYNKRHSGVDINRGGKDDDLGDKVYSIADGEIVGTGFFPVWGNIVLIKHAEDLYSQYAHLHQILVENHQTVTIGQVIGTIGKGAEDRYYAHLHFELRNKYLPPNFFTNDKEIILRHYYNPQTYYERNGLNLT